MQEDKKKKFNTGALPNEEATNMNKHHITIRQGVLWRWLEWKNKMVSYSSIQQHPQLKWMQQLLILEVNTSINNLPETIAANIPLAEMQNIDP